MRCWQVRGLDPSTCSVAGGFPGTAPVTGAGVSHWLPLVSICSCPCSHSVVTSTTLLRSLTVTVAKRAGRACGVTSSSLLAYSEVWCSSVGVLPAGRHSPSLLKHF